ncbi:MAG: DUF1177 family protein [Betaproteobacteria bacterium]|nr:DUF1177 family protein [Betaproteobacteria bacterium]
MPVVGVAITAQVAVPGCATSATSWMTWTGRCALRWKWQGLGPWGLPLPR